MLEKITNFDEISKSYYNSVMSPEQCMAARALLRWTQAELAAKAKVSVNTILDFEAGRREPHPNNLTAMRGALETAGVRFLGTTGIDIKPTPPKKGR
jgi:ribosome-binding protein aMBF1 (putative translation factor)